MFNRNDWFQAWQAITPGKDRRLYFRHGTGYMVVFQNAMSASLKISNNRIDVTTENIESFRLYLNDQMVDLSRTVTVVVNKKPKFEGMVKTSMDEMLKDQLFLGADGVISAPDSISMSFLPPRPTTGPTTGPASHLRKGRIIVGPTTEDQ